MSFRQNLKRWLGLLQILRLRTKLGFGTNWSLIYLSYIGVSELVFPRNINKQEALMMELSHIAISQQKVGNDFIF